jgi:hypothetical protein
MLSIRCLLPFALAGTMGCAGAAFTTASDPDSGSADALGQTFAHPTDASADAGYDARFQDDAPIDSARDAESDADGAGADTEVDSAPDGSMDATSVGSDASEDAIATDAHEACVPRVYYLDGDGDLYGGTTTSTGCAPPDGRAWVLRGGDCDDSNPNVSPGQMGYFAQGYLPTGKSALSFDYDCSGQETESGTPAKAACALSALTCAGSGYLEASPVRSGGGVDPFCGSVQAVTCAVISLVCQAGPPYTASPIACH